MNFSVARQTESPQKVIHVFVALCDNKYQGIVKVPAAIGNGQDAARNLYWGCGYGVKSFFKTNGNWTLKQSIKNPATNILERCIFKHKNSNTWLIADAYDGQYIKNCTIDFLKAAAGQNSQTLTIDQTKINCGGQAELIAYCGHDGLMDFNLDSFPIKANNQKRQVIILACISKSYFFEAIKTTGAQPLLWTTGLMAPEAYTLSAAIESWIKNEPADSTKLKAAEAYNQYQKIGRAHV